MTSTTPDALDQLLSTPAALRARKRFGGLALWAVVSAAMLAAVALGCSAAYVTDGLWGLFVAVGLVVLARPTLDAAAVRVGGARGPLIVWLAAPGLALGVAIAALGRLEFVVVPEPFRTENHLRSDDPVPGLLCALPAMLVLAALASLVAALIGRRDRRWVSSLLRRSVPIALGTAATLGAIGTCFALTRPTPRGFLDTLPVVARMAPPAGASDRSAVTDDWVEVLGDRQLHRRCEAERCVLALVPGRSNFGSELATTVRTDEVRVRRDPRRRVALVEWSGHQMAVRSLEGGAPQPTAVHVNEMLRVSRPPLAWLALAWLGLALGARSWSRRGDVARSEGEWRSASVGADGRVVLDDQTPVELPQGTAVSAPGELLVRPAAGTTPGSYRDAERCVAERALQVTADELAVTARGLIDSRQAYALAAMLLCNLPLACHVVGGLTAPIVVLMNNASPL